MVKEGNYVSQLQYRVVAQPHLVPRGEANVKLEKEGYTKMKAGSGCTAGSPEAVTACAGVETIGSPSCRGSVPDGGPPPHC